MTRTTARFILALIPLAVLGAASLVHVDVNGSMWPFFGNHGHHVLLSLFIMGAVFYTVACVAAAFLIVGALIYLWEAAK